MKEKLTYEVLRGKKAGIVLSPHRYEDGNFKAYKTNSRNDPNGRLVATETELLALVRSVNHVRMTNMNLGHAPSTVKPKIVTVQTK